jgi:hypothetical protein
VHLIAKDLCKLMFCGSVSESKFSAALADLVSNEVSIRFVGSLANTFEQLAFICESVIWTH